MSRLGFLACGALLLAVVAWGGDGEEKTPAPTEAPAASDRTAAPTATSRPSASPTAPSGGGASPFSGRLPDVNSYRYSFRIEGTAGLIAELSGSSLPAGVNPNTGTLAFEVKGAYVKPDRGEATITLASTTVKKVVIGRQVWTDVGAGFVGPLQLAASGDDDYSFVAAFWDSSPTEALEDFSCGSGRETVNGVSTRKCTADRATVERLNREGKLFTTGELDLEEFTAGSAEIWVAEEDKVIRFRANLAGKDTLDRNVVFKIEVDITDINARFTIDPPR